MRSWPPPSRASGAGSAAAAAATGGGSSPRTFRVSDFGCDGGLNRTDLKDLTTGTPVDCTAAIAAAVAAAGALSPAPSTVLFPAGRWYLHPPLLVPDGVTLAGESMAATGLYFSYTGKINGSWGEPGGLPALIGPAPPTQTSNSSNSSSTFGVRQLRNHYCNLSSRALRSSFATPHTPCDMLSGSTSCRMPTAYNLCDQFHVCRSGT